jgi:methionyl-tRNA formyltransferase
MAAGLRIVFMGTPDFAVPALQALIDSPHDVIAVYSQPPRPKGRGQQTQKSPVHILADAHGIPVYTPKSFKKDPDAVAQFKSLQADVAVVAAYGLILPLSVLDAPKYGCLNIHASLLPRWRGASPIQHAIWKGDATSGVTIMRMEEGLDTGPMLLKQEISITGMTTPALHDALSAMGGGMILRVLNDIAEHELKLGDIQDEANSLYAPLLKKEDGRIDWTQSADAIDRQVRALNPWPGTFTMSAKGQRLKILQGKPVPATGTADSGAVMSRDGTIACGGGTSYRLLQVQPDNAKPMDAASAVNGGYLSVGEKLA